MNCASSKNFEWGEAKSNACFLERGLGLDFAVSAFADPDRIIQQDNRYGYEEDGRQLIGCIRKLHFMLVYTLHYDAINLHANEFHIVLRHEYWPFEQKQFDLAKLTICCNPLSHPHKLCLSQCLTFLCKNVE